MERIYGPYTRKDGRKHMCIYNPETKKKTSMSYPKYLMQQILGRELLPHETVDHIDNDFTNDDPSNLQILTFEEHRKLDHRLNVPMQLVCVWCNKQFEVKAINGRFRKYAGPFCSKVCCGKYGAEIQNKRIDPIEKTDKPKQEYYKLKNL